MLWRFLCALAAIPGERPFPRFGWHVQPIRREAPNSPYKIFAEPKEIERL
jgi:hypothetical protein